MPPSATRVASRFHVAYGGSWGSLPSEYKETVFGAWVFHLRQHLNGHPGTVFMNGRPKPTKVTLAGGTVDGDARLQLVGFAVPGVGFVEYDDARRQVKVLSRSGGVLAHVSVNIRFSPTVSGLKQAGKDLAYQSILLLNDVKLNTPERTREREQAEKAEAERIELVRRDEAGRQTRQKEDMKRQKAELDQRAEAERAMAGERQWVASLSQYLGTVPHKRKTLDRGYPGGPYQTSNTTIEQHYVDIGPWLSTSGLTANQLERALPTLSKSSIDALVGVLGPGQIKEAPIGHSKFRLGLEGTNLTLTFSETIYFN
jgi:hypothetical protein